MAILGELARSASELDVGEAREGLNAAERLLDLAANHLDRPEYLEYLALTSRWAKRWVDKLQEFERSQERPR